MNSEELAIKISELHLRKSGLVKETKQIESQLQGLEGETRRAKVSILNELMGELASVNENLKAYAVLFRSCTDQQILKYIEKNHPSIYQNAENLHRGIR